MAAQPRKQTIPTPRVFKPLLSSARYKGAWGGRGSGKSHFFAELAIEQHMRYPGTRGVCIREVQRSLEQSVKRLLEDKIEALSWGSYFRVMDAKIETPGGGVIIFQGMQNHTADSIKSLEGYDWAWVEEAQSLSARSLELLRPTIRKPKSELWFSWNPHEPTDPIDRFLRGQESPPDSIVVESNWRDNPWFPDVLKTEKDYDYRVDPETAEHVWGGAYWQRSDAQVLSGKWTVEEFEPELGWDGPYQGADWGFAVDPTVLVRVWLREDGCLMVEREAYAVGCDLDDTPELFDSVPGSRKHIIRADSARPETISHMARRGFSIIGADKWPGSVEDGVAYLRSVPKIIIHPRCKHTIQESRVWSYKTDRLTGDVLPKLVDLHNHCWDAIRYACGPMVQGHGRGGVVGLGGIGAVMRDDRV